MKTQNFFRDQRGVDFQLKLRPAPHNPEGAVIVRKTAQMVARYRALASALQGCNMLELGLWDGGSTALFSGLFLPTEQIGVDLSERPLRELEKYVARAGTVNPIHTYSGVDQASASALAGVLSGHAVTALDLVIDDASHLLQQTTRSFNLLFPRLRPGGLYIIEDWSSEHAIERTLEQAIRAGTLNATQEQKLAEGTVPTEPLSRLVLEIVLVAASRPDLIASVSVRQNLVEVTRGPADLDPADFDLQSCIGPLGKSLLTGIPP